MIFRRATQQHTTSDLDAQDRRRRAAEVGSGGSGASGATDASGASADEGPGEGAAQQGLPPLPSGDGPYDADDVDLDHTSRRGRVDLGGMVLRPGQGVELRLQVDETSKAVVAAILLAGEQGGSAMELRCFAAPRSTGLWDEVRGDVAAESARRGGTATETRGPFGTELAVSVPVQTADGTTTTQASRIVGIDGPRWFLRATFLGRAATDPEAARPLEAALRDAVVVRGRQPMAPRDFIPLRLPPEARRSQDQPDTAAPAPDGSL